MVPELVEEDKMKNITQKLRSIIGWIGSQSLTKRIIVAVIIIALVFILQPSSDEATINYQTTTATTGSVTQVISETGEIMSTGKTDVASTITGIVQELYIENGEVVQRGQSLFKVTSSATEEERAKAYASYLTAKNTLETAERNKLTYESDMWVAHELYESNATDQNLAEDDPIYIEYNRDWEAAEQKYLDQDQVIAQTQASVSSTWLAYQATIDGIVKAPISGTIANLSISTGQHVNSTDNALIISSSEAAWITLAVSEADVTTIEPEQTAIVSVDALKSTTFNAIVERVDEFGTVSSGIVTYNIYLSLTDPSSSIKPNMTVQVDITTAEKDGVLTVPNSAIKPYQGGRAVQVLSPKTSEPMYFPVEIGIAGETHTEILDGVKEGQEVIIGQSIGTPSDDGDKSGSLFPVGGGGGGTGQSR